LLRKIVFFTLLLLAGHVIAFESPVRAASRQDSSILLDYSLASAESPLESDDSEDTSPGYFSDWSISDGYSPITLTLRHTIGKSVWSTQSYTTLEGRYFWKTDIPRVWSFIDIGCHRFDNNTYATNLGVGFRYLLNDSSDILGFNVYQDSLYTKCNTFNQIGLGLEFLSEGWAARINGYLPIGPNEKQCGGTDLFNDYVGDFFFISQHFETALTGVDFEIESVLWRCHCFSFSVMAAPYYYHNGGCGTKNIFGVSVGAKLNVMNYLDFSFYAARGGFCETRLMGQLAINIPFGCFCEDQCCGCCYDRCLLYQPTRRNDALVMHRFCRSRWNW